MGKVYLVGGGPGDIGLMSVKALELIQTADCILYDRLVNPKILQEVKGNCECIYVGKQNRHHTMKQEDINQLLVEKAMQYACVVRLKGGDVYVFGRGGEEGLYLHEHQIAFEVVPGISSCIAGLAYAGIPITHRGVASGFHVISAHHQQDECKDINFKELAQSDDTCVFLMGLTKLKEIVDGFIKAGKPLDTPVAMISNATLPQQQVRCATLSTIVKEHERSPLASPVIIVVGHVVKLRESLNVFEQLPLFHKRIILPRVTKQPSSLAKRLTQLGGDICEFQVSTLNERRDALHSIQFSSYDMVILSSRHCVNFFMNALKRNCVDIRTLHHIDFAVVGKASAKELQNYGIYETYCPTYHSAQALCEVLCREIPSTTRILIPKVKGNDEEWEMLKSYANVDILPLYEVSPVDIQENIEEMQTGDAIVFTCSSSVRNTLSTFQIPPHMHVYSIGDKTTQTLIEYGISNSIQAKQASYDALYECIIEKEGTGNV